MGTGSFFKTRIASLRRSLSCFCRDEINFKDLPLIFISKVMLPIPSVVRIPRLFYPYFVLL